MCRFLVYRAMIEFLNRFFIACVGLLGTCSSERALVFVDWLNILLNSDDGTGYILLGLCAKGIVPHNRE